MNISVYDITVCQFDRSLSLLSRLLDKAAVYVASKKIADATLLQTRLVPDQFPLSKQVQIACDNAKLCIPRLTTQQAPVFEDTETSIDELKARIQSTLDFLRSVPQDAFTADSLATRTVTFPWRPGHYLTAYDYVVQYLLPNFYFHVTTAYSILRSCGLELGKTDYMNLPWKSE